MCMYTYVTDAIICTQCPQSCFVTDDIVETEAVDLIVTIEMFPEMEEPLSISDRPNHHCDELYYRVF